ncbi:hypothetical protein [Moraxella bovis]|uniref:Uncharacterized protein n=1 Tax=Moraxella bovis TaxID=476 RepID=A0A378PPX5_MORBO|nr:hypothetical protein [Moraxella bovis]UYZ68832.1 hypothetical protein LP122_01585 [Moraxella bovis]UYZ71208.1 hypothetical protein LP089_01630 [Moraxella bovis]UYZ72877.1 hypothetical protein LP105_11020 [Moraxella bovis]UZA14502.1 hypothetical protein LP102_01580 [Moraxella bovis]UZA24276.1 hypothetical protein LP117_10985 [Moraxella bovis]
MRTDTEIKVKGIQTLIHAMGEVDAERFISFLSKEPFDYTIWQRELMNDLPVETLSQMAMKHRHDMIG